MIMHYTQLTESSNNVIWIIIVKQEALCNRAQLNHKKDYAIELSLM